MKKTKKDLEKEAEASHSLISKYREQVNNLEVELRNLGDRKEEDENNIKRLEKDMENLNKFKYLLIQILAGPSKPISKAEAIEDLMAVDVYFARKEFEERKKHGPYQRHDPMQLI